MPSASSESATPWREGWEPFDPLRPCYSCGEPPSGWFDREGTEPRYDHSHWRPGSTGIEPTAPLGVWSARATREEVARAWERARAIVAQDEAEGRTPKYVPRGKTMTEMHARGQLAEIVAARLTGLPHHTALMRRGYRRSQKKADIGHVEVRNTRRHDGGLAIYENDPPMRVVLLVTGHDPFVLRGWIRAADGRHPRFWDPFRNQGGAEEPRWTVPQDHLHPMPVPPR